jgi:hypothetical protein
MPSKARIDLAQLLSNIRIANIIFCAVIFVFGLWTFLITRSLPALFVCLAFFLFGLSLLDAALDVNRRYLGRHFACQMLAYFLVLAALIASFKL